MQLLKFERAPEDDNNTYVIKMLEAALEEAKKGEITLAVLITANDDYEVSANIVVDSPLEVAGLLSTALNNL